MLVVRVSSLRFRESYGDKVKTVKYWHFKFEIGLVSEPCSYLISCKIVQGDCADLDPIVL